MQNNPAEPDLPQSKHTPNTLLNAICGKAAQAEPGRLRQPSCQARTAVMTQRSREAFVCEASITYPAVLGHAIVRGIQHLHLVLVAQLQQRGQQVVDCPDLLCTQILSGIGLHGVASPSV